MEEAVTSWVLIVWVVLQFVSPRTDMFVQDFVGAIEKIMSAAHRELTTHGSWCQERHLQHELIDYLMGGADGTEHEVHTSSQAVR